MIEGEGVKEGFQDRAGVLGVDADQLRYRYEDEKEDLADDEVVNFCQDCSKVVSLQRRRRKNHCVVCQGQAIFIGTKRGIKHYFRLKKLDYSTEEEGRQKEMPNKA